MTQAIGFNIPLRYVKDIGKLYRRMDALQPAVQTVMIDKDEHIPYVLDFAARYPQTLIVARVRDGNDGGFHMEPVNDSQKRRWIAAPEDFLNRWGVLGRGSNLSLYALNEPKLSENTPDWVVDRFNEWVCMTGELAVRRNIALTLPNIGMGQPGITTTVPVEWEGRFDPLLRLVSKHRDQLTLGLHEYVPEEPHHWGRIMYMLQRCLTLGIPSPNVVLTEFGVDATHGPRNGYKARGWSGDHYMRQCASVIKRIYSPLIARGILKGICFFIYGSPSPEWEPFDVENDEPFFDTLTYAIASGSMNVTKPIPVITPPVEPPVIEPPVKLPPPPPEKPTEPPPTTPPAAKTFNIPLLMTVEAESEEVAALLARYVTVTMDAKYRQLRYDAELLRRIDEIKSVRFSIEFKEGVGV